jgi:hypothetical protein
MEDTDKNKESTEKSCCYCVVDGCGCVVGSYCCDDSDMSNCTFETS